LVRVRRSDEDACGQTGGILGDAAVHPNTLAPIVESWSVQRVADMLHVSESTVRRLIAAHAFPGAFRVGRKLVRIPITDLDAYQRRARLLAQRIAEAEHVIDQRFAGAIAKGTS
jgi:excisionase family DNA binding protein